MNLKLTLGLEFNKNFKIRKEDIMRNLTNTRRTTVKNFYITSAGKTQASFLNTNLNPKLNNKYERRNKMNNLNLKKQLRQSAAALSFLLILFINAAFTGCGDSNVTDIQQNKESDITAAGNKTKSVYYDSTSIKFDLNLRFKSQIIQDSKVLESNTGNNFNHIASISQELKPGEILDLQEIQNSGIFALYLSSDGLFTLYNLDGMSFTSKTIFLERCSFIDLKLRNEEQKPIKVTGLVAGE